MTRINTIDPVDLLDQHLFIEYREITRVATLHRMPDSNKWPLEYVLGTGHVKFFYDKGEYLAKRCKALYAELIKRGYKPTEKQYKTHSYMLHNDWVPARADHIANLTRLQTKLSDKPTFYTLYGKQVDAVHYAKLVVKYGS